MKRIDMIIKNVLNEVKEQQLLLEIAVQNEKIIFHISP